MDGALSQHDLSEMAGQPLGVPWVSHPYSPPQGFSQARGAKALSAVTQSEPVALQVLESQRNLFYPSSFPVIAPWPWMLETSFALTLTSTGLCGDLIYTSREPCFFS